MSIKIRNLLLILTLVLVFSFLVWVLSLTMKAETEVKSSFYEDIQTLELADTDEKRSKGLMFREELCDGCGMLFDFQKPHRVQFYMKNTLIPLDMIMFKENGYIDTIHRDTEPYQITPTYNSESAVKYVLEMPAGFADQHDLKPGQVIDVERLESKITPTT